MNNEQGLTILDLRFSITS